MTDTTIITVPCPTCKGFVRVNVRNGGKDFDICKDCKDGTVDRDVNFTQQCPNHKCWNGRVVTSKCGDGCCEETEECDVCRGFERIAD